jgi:hypothetical protein
MERLREYVPVVEISEGREFPRGPWSEAWQMRAHELRSCMYLHHSMIRFINIITRELRVTFRTSAMRSYGHRSLLFIYYIGLNP